MMIFFQHRPPGLKRGNIQPYRRLQRKFVLRRQTIPGSMRCKFPDRLLVLQGQPGSWLRMCRAIAIRSVAIEAGLCRS